MCLSNQHPYRAALAVGVLEIAGDRNGIFATSAQPMLRQIAAPRIADQYLRAGGRMVPQKCERTLGGLALIEQISGQDDIVARLDRSAIAERISFAGFLLAEVAMGAIIYPIYGMWMWGGGWMAHLGISAHLGHGASLAARHRGRGQPGRGLPPRRVAL